MPSRQRVAIEMALPAIEAIEDDSIVFKTSQPSPVGEVKHVARVVSDDEHIDMYIKSMMKGSTAYRSSFVPHYNLERVTPKS